MNGRCVSILGGLLALGLLTSCYTAPPDVPDVGGGEPISPSIKTLTTQELSTQWDQDWQKSPVSDRQRICASYNSQAQAAVDALAENAWTFIEQNYPVESRGTVTYESLQSMYHSKLAANC